MRYFEITQEEKDNPEFSIATIEAFGHTPLCICSPSNQLFVVCRVCGWNLHPKKDGSFWCDPNRYAPEGIYGPRSCEHLQGLNEENRHERPELEVEDFGL